MLHCYVLTCDRSVTAFLAPPRSQLPGQGPRSRHPKAGRMCTWAENTSQLSWYLLVLGRSARYICRGRGGECRLPGMLNGLNASYISDVKKVCPIRSHWTVTEVPSQSLPNTASLILSAWNISILSCASPLMIISCLVHDSLRDFILGIENHGRCMK
jgi:hypothetical protein